MKTQIRNLVFETNSSMTHSITLCSDDEIKKWDKGEIVFDNWSNSFITPEEALEHVKKYCDNYNLDDEAERETAYHENGLFKSIDDFMDYYSEEFETYEENYETPKGESVVAFGYYGQD
jgi:uncharacterized radical SAM superfamily Fe-S cluster-containing enzyme